MLPRQQGESFTLSVEARRNVSTGISAADRATTLRTLAITSDIRNDLISPGHIFPIKTRRGGVLVKTGASEAAVDLMLMAGRRPVAILIHILNDSGNYFAPSELPNDPRFKDFSSLRLSELIKHRLATEEIIREVAVTNIPCFELGSFRTRCFVSETDGAEHVAFIRGDSPSGGNVEPFTVRVQSESLANDLFPHSSASGDSYIHRCLALITETGSGAFIYVRHPQLSMKHDKSGSNMQSSKSSELRELGIGAQIIRKLGLQKIRLITGSSRELAGLDAFGLDVVERVPI
jgi:3,4-dihydroxy 2-butanone 4-phosphate synthase/GTP cyclohydrolase II